MRLLRTRTWLAENGGGLIGLVLLLALAAIAVLAPEIAPGDPLDMVARPLQPPFTNPDVPLGTDQLYLLPAEWETRLKSARAHLATPFHEPESATVLDFNVDGPRDFAFMEWDLNASRCGVELRLRTARTRTHKLTIEEISGAGELSDLVDDPYEMNNRFDDPALANVQAELMDMIASRPDDARTEPLEPVGMA